MKLDLDTISIENEQEFFEQLTKKFELGCKLQLELLNDLKLTRDTIDIVANHLSNRLSEK